MSITKSLKKLFKKNENIEISETENEVYVVVKNPEKYIDFINYEKSSGIVYYNDSIYVDFMTKESNVEDVLAMVAGINKIFETDFSVKKLISPTVWSKLTGINDAYLDERYTSAPVI